MRFLKEKCPSLCYFFTDFDENVHEALASDLESESLLILKKLVLRNVSKTKMPLTLSFVMDFDQNAHEGSSLDGELEIILILKNLFCKDAPSITKLNFNVDH